MQGVKDASGLYEVERRNRYAARPGFRIGAQVISHCEMRYLVPRVVTISRSPRTHRAFGADRHSNWKSAPMVGGRAEGTPAKGGSFQSSRSAEKPSIYRYFGQRAKCGYECPGARHSIHPSES